MSSRIDVKSIIDEISNKYNASDINIELQNLRDDNHRLYYNVDIDFLNNVDAKYKNEALEIIK